MGKMMYPPFLVFFFFLFISVFESTAYLKIRKIAVFFLWLLLPGDYTDEALLAETT